MSVTSNPRPLPAKPELILTAGQATAIYNAMCELNSVSAVITSIGLRDESGMAVSFQIARSMWCVMSARAPSEWHDGQAAFAAAYGLEA